MPQLHVTTRNGEVHAVDADIDISVMEAIRMQGIDEVVALCGGACSCATCHVYIDEAWLHQLPPISADEDDLLDSSDHRTNLSRLSCQIRVADELDGLTLTVAPED